MKTRRIWGFKVIAHSPRSQQYYVNESFLVGGFQPIWKIWVKNGKSSPILGVKKKKWNHHLVFCSLNAGLDTWNQERQEGPHEGYHWKTKIGSPKVPKKPSNLSISPEKNQPHNGKSPLFKGKTSSNAWFSIVHVSFFGGVALNEKLICLKSHLIRFSVLIDVSQFTKQQKIVTNPPGCK